jgi:hypothetical protein
MVRTPFVLAVTLMLAPKVASADKIKVAVVPSVAVNLDATHADALAQDLAQALSAELEVDAVGGLDVRRQLPADGVPADCTSNPSCTADVAKRTGARQLLFVVMVGGSEHSVTIDTTWVEPASGHQASRPAVDLTSTADADAKAKFQTVAHQLLPEAPVRPKPKAGLSLDTKMTEATPRHFTTASRITAGVAGAGLVGDVTFWLITRSKFNTCNDHYITCAQPERDSISHYALAADISLGVALGGAIATAALYATSGEAPHVVISPSPEGGSVSLVGRF